jgi:hypothetical protein
MTAPPRSAVPFCNPTKNNSTPAVRASHFSLFWDSPSLRDQEKGHANRKETERLSLAVGRSAHKSQGSGGEGERERAAFFFLWIPSVSQSHGILPERHKHLRPCYCEVLVSTSAKERESGGGGMRPVPPPLPLLCSSVFLLLLLLCRPLAANGRTVRAEASSPGPLPHSVNGSIASSNGGAAAVRPANTASPPVGRSAAPSGVTGS